MSASTQVAITSDSSGQLWSICIWDLVTGSTLMTYKSSNASASGISGVCGSRAIATISDQFLIAAQKDSPIINVWSLQRREQLQLKTICPSRVTSLTVTPDGVYCIASLVDKIYIWQISTGNLLLILERHYQPITCIKSSSDGSYFITAGEDGFAMVWLMSHLLSSSGSSNLGVNVATDTMTSVREPWHTWSHHSGKITDVCIGFGGISARCATCSVDQTCKVYEVASGTLLVSLVFDTPLWSVAMDSAEYFLFVGGENGNIYETRFYGKPSINDIREEAEPVFTGHSGKVNCLSVSIDGLALLSGSQDGDVKVWHTTSKQCMRTIKHKGPITNAFIIPTPSGLLSKEISKSPSLPIQPFKRHLINETNDSASDFAYDHGSIVVKINNTPDFDTIQTQDITLPKIQNTSLPELNYEGNDALQEEIKKLKNINEQMYNYSVDAIFKITQ